MSKKTESTKYPKWKLDNGKQVTAKDLIDEIALVPRTRFWRLSHLVLLWPVEADPDSSAKENGFTDGFVLELLTLPNGVEWLLQPVNSTIADRKSGQEKSGRDAVIAAFHELDLAGKARMDERRKARPATSKGETIPAQETNSKK